MQKKCSSRHSFQVSAKPLATMVLALAASVSLTLPFSAQAATITVTSASDAAAPAGGCSLRGAVAAINGAANANGCVKAAADAYGTNDTIVFAPALAGSTITFASEIVIQKNLVLDGNINSTTAITLDGNNATRLLHARGGTALTARHLTFQNGNPGGGGGGGAIYSDWPGLVLTVQDSRFDNNSASWGGAIHAATATVSNSTFSGNSASWGGAIYALSTVTVSNSTFSGNSASWGGAIYTEATVTVSSSTFSGNSASWGGAICLNAGTGTLKNSLIVGTGAVSQCHGNFLPGGTNLEWRDGNNANSCNSSTPILVPAGFTLAQIVSTTLADNGGPTPTLALPVGSPAIDAGDPAVTTNTDQRGQIRPQGNGPDLGAFEAGSQPSTGSSTGVDVTTQVVNGVTLTTINGRLVSYPEHVGMTTATFVFTNIAGTDNWLLLNPETGWHPWVDCASSAFPYSFGTMPWVTDISLFYSGDLSPFHGWPVLFGYGVGDTQEAACADMFNNARYTHVTTL